jgi:hypothetical protein
MVKITALSGLHRGWTEPLLLSEVGTDVAAEIAVGELYFLCL